MKTQPKKQWSELCVAITGMNNRPENPGPGYAIARCLRSEKEFNGRIVGLGYDALDGGLYHRQMCNAAYLLPYPSSGEEALFERIKSIHAEEKIDVLIPSLDAELIAMSRLRPRLLTLGIQMLIPDQAAIEARNKDRLPELCSSAGLNTPRIKNVANADFFKDCHLHGWEYPLVIKGKFYDASIAQTQQQAITAFHRIAQEWGLPVLVQPFIAGNEFNVCALGDGEGGTLGSVMMRKRALTDKGKAWAGTSIFHAEIKQVAETLIHSLKWLGPLEVELLRDMQGNFHLIEINPRFPAWVYLTHGVGCNLPIALLKLISGELNEPIALPRAGVTFIRYAEEVLISLADLEAMTVTGGRSSTPNSAAMRSISGVFS